MQIDNSRWTPLKGVMFLLAFLGGMASFLWMPYASAQGIPKSTYEALEYTMDSLKESAQQIRNKNRWYQADNQRLDNEIRQLRNQWPLNEEQVFKAQEKRETNPSLQKNKGDLLLKQQVIMSNKNIAQLEQDSAQLEQKITSRVQALGELQRKIDALKRENKIWPSRIKTYQQQATDNTTEFNKSRLIGLKKAGQARIQELERDSNRQMKKQKEVLDKLNVYKAQQKDLQDTATSLQDEMDRISQEQIKHSEELTQFQKDQDVLWPQLTQDIINLKARQHKLEEILTEAKSKLSNRKVGSTAYNPEKQQLLENLDVLRRENSDLKEQYLTLEKTFREIEAP